MRGSQCPKKDACLLFSNDSEPDAVPVRQPPAALRLHWVADRPHRDPRETSSTVDLVRLLRPRSPTSNWLAVRRRTPFPGVAERVVKAERVRLLCRNGVGLAALELRGRRVLPMPRDLVELLTCTSPLRRAGSTRVLPLDVRRQPIFPTRLLAKPLTILLRVVKGDRECRIAVAPEIPRGVSVRPARSCAGFEPPHKGLHSQAISRDVEPVHEDVKFVPRDLGRRSRSV